MHIRKQECKNELEEMSHQPTCTWNCWLK